MATIDNGGMIGTLFIDFRKAYNKMDQFTPYRNNLHNIN